MRKWLGMPLLLGSVLGFVIVATANAEPSADSSEELSLGRYITSGVIGTAVGLGIGHGIQGRYLPLGLVFSVGEAAGWVAFFADTDFTTKRDDDGYRETRVSHIGVAGAIGLGVAIGLHLWEIADIWIKGDEMLRRSKAHAAETGITVLPVVLNEHAPGMSVLLHF